MRRRLSSKHAVGHLVSGLAACALLIGCLRADAADNRLTDIQARGVLTCGIWPYVPGFALERDGQYAGFDIDLCRAVAAAVLGDPKKVRFIPLNNIAQFAERQDIDFAVRRLTWTLNREKAHGMVFGPITFYDGQGFLVPESGGIKIASQLAGARVCVLNQEHHPEYLSSYYRDSGREIQLVLVDNDSQAEQALRSRRCRAYSADISWLAAARSRFADGVRNYRILRERISKEPLAPLMRMQDSEFARVVQWTIFTLINAEELGLTSENIQALQLSSTHVRTFLNLHPGDGVVPGAGDWVRAIITGVGNYGQIYERNLGADSPIKLDRGMNRLWNQGGLLYAPSLDR